MLLGASHGGSWSGEAWRLLTLQDANTRVVVLGAAGLGLAAGVVGALAVLRRRALVGDAVAHAALPGLAIAFLATGERRFGLMLAGALAAGLLAVLALAAIRAWTRVKEDAAIALVIGCFFGVGILLSQRAQRLPGGNKSGLDGFLFGSAASMVRDDARLILAGCAVLLAFVVLLHKELRAVCFDPGFAASIGLPVARLDLALLAAVCVCTVIGLPAVGVVLMVALLVIPGAAARFWTDRLGVMLALSGAIGLASGVGGTLLSGILPTPAGALSRGWPTGPMIVLTAGAVFTVSALFAPGRGLVATILRRAGLRRRVAFQDLLRDLYERSEREAAPTPNLTPARRAPTVSPSAVRRALREGLVRPVGPGLPRTLDALALTPVGLERARAHARAHRLWELFLIHHAHVSPDHVDRDADEIEHVLPHEILAQLEAELEQGLRADRPVPPSPHALAAEPAP